jgi:23S rRNA-/tRNA-specific pseudouridylate synthase
VGDGKYGNAELNKEAKRRNQELVAYRLMFGAEISEEFELKYLKGLEICISREMI